MDEEIFLKYCEIFIKEVNIKRKEHNYDGWAILFTNGHNSRCNEEVISLLKDNRIHLMIFPHCTHLIQPLDLTVFGEFKKHIN
jgi:hypothetical protein